jgi:hypothetical protein
MVGTRGGSWLDGYEGVFKTTRLGIARSSKETFVELLGPDTGVIKVHDSYLSKGHSEDGSERIGFRCVRDVPLAVMGSTVGGHKR